MNEAITWKKEKTMRESASEMKKEKIYSTALELFRIYGYEKTTLKDISSASGISEGSIYYYYGSKWGILSRINNNIFMDTAEYISLTDENLGVPEKSILDYLLAQARICEGHGFDIIKNLFMSAPISTTEFEFLPNKDENLVLFISEAQKQGTIKSSEPPEDIAALLITTRIGLVCAWIYSKAQYSLIEASRNIIQRVLATI